MSPAFTVIRAIPHRDFLALVVARSSPDLPNHLVGQPGDDAVGVRVGQHQDEVRRASLDQPPERSDRRRQVVVAAVVVPRAEVPGE
jgi:hypothetical protein